VQSYWPGRANYFPDLKSQQAGSGPMFDGLGRALSLGLPKTVHELTYVNVNVSQKYFSVAKIAELLRSPQRRSRLTIQNQEMTVGKEMFLDVDGKQVEMEMIECQLAVSSKGVIQRLQLEYSVIMDSVLCCIPVI